MALQIYLKGHWDHVYIKRSRSIPPGLYELQEGVDAEAEKTYKGPILAVHDGIIYQATKSGVVKHSDKALGLEQIPEIESFTTIAYTQDPPIIKRMSNKEVIALKSIT